MPGPISDNRGDLHQSPDIKARPPQIPPPKKTQFHFLKTAVQNLEMPLRNEAQPPETSPPTQPWQGASPEQIHPSTRPIPIHSADQTTPSRSRLRNTPPTHLASVAPRAPAPPNANGLRGIPRSPLLFPLAPIWRLISGDSGPESGWSGRATFACRSQLPVPPRSSAHPRAPTPTPPPGLPAPRSSPPRPAPVVCRRH